MDLKSIVGNAATIVTVASFFSGGLVCFKIFQKRSTGDFSAFPFISGCLCNALWLRYGLYVSDPSLINVNLMGLIIQANYVICFYIYCNNKVGLHKQLVMTCVIITLITGYLVLIPKDDESAMFASGMIACTGSLVFVASPLATLSEVIRNKSVESLPFPIISSTFLVMTLWFIYGFIVKDAFIQVPNGIGGILSGLQLSLFVIYPSSKKAIHSE